MLSLTIVGYIFQAQDSLISNHYTIIYTGLFLLQFVPFDSQHWAFINWAMFQFIIFVYSSKAFG